jgi:hypothetical protein
VEVKRLPIPEAVTDISLVKVLSVAVPGGCVCSMVLISAEVIW